MANPECVQTKTGQCGGCPIVDIATQRAGPRRERGALEKIAEETASDWCPEDTELEPLTEALKATRPKQSIW